MYFNTITFLSLEIKSKCPDIWTQLIYPSKTIIETLIPPD